MKVGGGGGLKKASPLVEVTNSSDLPAMTNTICSSLHNSQTPPDDFPGYAQQSLCVCVGGGGQGLLNEQPVATIPARSHITCRAS